MLSAVTSIADDDEGPALSMFTSFAVFDVKMNEGSGAGDGDQTNATLDDRALVPQTGESKENAH